MGDFNEICSLDETQGGNDVWTSGMDDFKNCLDRDDIDDIRAVGPHFTWWNSQGNRTISRKLDRALGNATWFSGMSMSLACFGASGFSDHNPVILNTGLTLRKSFKPFQFFNHLTLLEGYDEVVSQAWDYVISSSPLFILAEKLRRTKRALIDLNKQQGSTLSNVQMARQSLLFKCLMSLSHWKT